MNVFEPKIRRGKTEDAEILAPLAIEIFNDTFAGHSLNKPEDMSAYIAEALNLEQIRKELEDENTITFIVEIENRMVGFAKMREHSTEECVSDPRPVGNTKVLYIAGISRERNRRNSDADLLNGSRQQKISNNLARSMGI